MVSEQKASSNSGVAMIGGLLVLQVVSVLLLVTMPGVLKLVFALASLAVLISWFGFYMVAPNQSAVLQLFGRYVGTDNIEGLRWANPFYRQAESERSCRQPGRNRRRGGVESGRQCPSGV